MKSLPSRYQAALGAAGRDRRCGAAELMEIGVITGDVQLANAPGVRCSVELSERPH